jgi:hypothetical protein
MKTKKNERHHLKRRIAKMEIVLNLCASRKVVQRSCKRSMMCPWWGIIESESKEWL